MPEKMYLKSVTSASSLSDPTGNHSIYSFFRTHNIPKDQQEPIALPLFLKYGAWFQQEVVPDVDQTFVKRLAHDGEQFRVELEDGRDVQARRVVVAAGVSRFTYIPEFAEHLPTHLAGHTQVHKSFERFNGKQVVVVGCGQSGLETAALLHEAGANVEMILRDSVVWINRALYHKVGPLKHIFYPPSDVGPPGINWIIAFPQFYRTLPEKTRLSMDARAIRPSGAPWLRSRVENRFRITERTEIVEATEQNDKVHLKLSDGTTREIDYLMLGTGYRASLDKLPFIDPYLAKQVQTHNGYPVLNGGYEASVSGLHFVGALGARTFGPICRFVSGAKAPAFQIAHYAAS